MADVFLSDVHLRLDHPERGERLAAVVAKFGEGDRLFVIGDLCDFWFASRQARSGSTTCEGLKALRAFRDRGGELFLLPGNHDHLIGKFYERELGVGFAAPSMDLVVGKRRIHLVHGHLVGARKKWKGLMEGKTFLRIFGALPAPIANALDSILDNNNRSNLAETERHHKAIYRRRANAMADSTDLVIFGHIHTPCDDQSAAPRLIILGGWHKRVSYLRIDGDSIEHIIEQKPAS